MDQREKSASASYPTNLRADISAKIDWKICGNKLIEIGWIRNTDTMNAQ